MNTASVGTPVSRFSLWFGLLGGASAWTLHLMLAYVVAEFGCVSRLGERQYLGVSLVAWMALALSLLTGLLALSAAHVALRCHRRLAHPDQQVAHSAYRMTARAGLITSSLFAFIIVFESVPILFYLGRC